MNNYSFHDISLETTEVFTKIISEKDVDLFVELCGDTSPIHVNKSYAKKHGFENRVVHGLLTSSLYSTLVGVYLPGEKALLQSIETKFKTPVFPNDTLTVNGQVSYINEAFKIVEVKASIKNQDGKTVSTAKIIVGMRDE